MILLPRFSTQKLNTIFKPWYYREYYQMKNTTKSSLNKYTNSAEESQIFLERSIYSQKKVTVSADIDIKDWFIFYKKLPNKGDNEPFHKANLMIRWEDIELDRELTLDEIKVEIKSLADGKAAGPDNIPNELLKKLPIPILEKLRNILNNIMIAEKYPEIWTNSIMHPIFKNGERNNPFNYRGIALCSNKFTANYLPQF
ncbi:hypothetical protein LAZ67_9001272 [Cordylochernes scorpioides]|uniref:Reverse transcriptase n=1 Tax=Cordylochernes scorpioides TaxID=51811 RepID=A0ABY6KSX3_9ARAC|nr:hypothetical protein LAZ67_9001272 [Cordylochernes scorpioides]